MRGSDGAIIIDSRIDTAGFNEGIANLGKQIKTLVSILGLIYISGKAWQFLQKVISGAIQKVKDFMRAFRMFVHGLEYISRIGRRIEEVKTEFENLRVQLYSALLPAILAMLPAIYKIINALRLVARFIAFIIAAFTGQKTILEANVKGVNDLAKGTSKAKKEAEGALAAFDQIDVLQQPDETEDAGGAMGDVAGDFGFTEIPVPDKLLAFIERVKELILPLIAPLKLLWDELVRLGAIFWSIISPMFANWADEGGFLETLSYNIGLAILWLANKVHELGDWMLANQETVRTWTKVLLYVALVLGVMFVLALAAVIVIIGLVIAIIVAVILAFAWLAAKAAQVWPIIKQFFEDLWQTAKDAVAYVINWFAVMWARIQQSAARAKEWFRLIIFQITEYFKNAWDNVKRFFSVAMNAIVYVLIGIGARIRMIFDGIINGIRSKINGFITLVNKAITMINGLSIQLPELFGGGKLGVDIPLIPYLAKGAVIQPNAPFAAVLGDQRSGRNIETPEDLLRQIMREEMGGPSGPQEITINFAGSLGALVRELKPYIDKEDSRIGRSMLVRGAR